MADKLSSVSNVDIKLNLDVESAIKSLKLIQREAKKALKEIRELETAVKDVAKHE